MGFTTGFTGGVTLVLGLSYLTLQTHRRTRELQAETLRANAYVLNSLSYVPATAPPPRTIAEELALLEQQQELLARADQQRQQHRRGHGLAGRGEGFVERAKDRWNSEVEAAVRWAATKDWAAAREDAEMAAARVWARATGGGEAPATERARVLVAEGAAATRGAAARAGEVAQDGAAEARGAAASIWERGFRKSKEVVSRAKEVVGMAEQKVQEKAAEASKAAGASDVERVLQQRYERRDGVLSKSAEEMLEERYKPMVEQDNSNLRGL